jgi:hypothetical protein
MGSFWTILGYFGSFWGHVFNLLFGHFGLHLQVTLSEPVPKRGQKGVSCSCLGPFWVGFRVGFWITFGPFFDPFFGATFEISFLALFWP